MREINGNTTPQAGATKAKQCAPAAAAPAELSSRFRVVRSIGAGQYGRVFLAVDHASQDAAVAVKTVPVVISASAGKVLGTQIGCQFPAPSDAPDNAAAAPTDAKELRLWHEIAALTAVSRAGVAGTLALKDVVAQSGKTCLVTNFVVGARTLEAHLLAHGAMAERDARASFRQLAATIRDVHRTGWVHHDLSLNNVLIDALGATTVVDFGLAQPLSDAITSFGATPYYSAPELLLRLPHSQAVDVWALGVILFAMLGARLPFPATTLRELRARVLCCDTEPPVAPTGASADAAALIRAMLALEPTQRISMDGVLAHRWLAAQDE